MIFIVVCLFNSMRTTLVIVCTVPFAIIGVTAGCCSRGRPFGFMALLGVLALGGEQIKNSVVLLEELYIEMGRGKTPYPAIAGRQRRSLAPGAAGRGDDRARHDSAGHRRVLRSHGGDASCSAWRSPAS